MERAPDGEIYLYHGTNCYRRWEINRSGTITPGRSGYSFYSNTPQDALTYARAACMRDLGPYAANSLICEPVVLKVRFTPRTWLQTDFIQQAGNSSERPVLCIAVLGPVSAANVVEVLNCCHGRQRQSTRSFADGTLREGIKRLRERTTRFRLDAWFLKKSEVCLKTVTGWLSRKETVEVTPADEIRRLTSASFR